MTHPWLDAWRSAGMEPQLLPCGAGHLLTSTRGARAIPLDEDGRPLLWVSPALQPTPAGAPDAARALTEQEWNTGGERLWLAPEIRFMIHDRRDFDGSYELPPAMDPGAWAADRSEPGCFRQMLELVARDSNERLQLDVVQRLAPAADPLRRRAPSTADPLRQGAPSAADSLRPRAPSAAVRHLGWTREVRLQRTASDGGAVPCQAWAIAQVPAGGVAWVPGGAGARLTDYFEPIDDAHRKRGAEHLSLNVDGRRRYKVGVRSGEHRGQLLYWREADGRELGEGRTYLYLRRFLDLPSSRYLEQPPALADHEGDSAYVYNDDGRHGDFGELEVLGRALEPDQATVADLFEMHVWWGPTNEVAEVARAWLGADWYPTQA